MISYENIIIEKKTPNDKMLKTCDDHSRTIDDQEVIETPIYPYQFSLTMIKLI